MEEDTYKTIAKASQEVLFKDKNSKFYGYAFPVNNEEDIKILIESLKKQHHSARHWCYAFQLGTQEEFVSFRANDDGEPNNSAGMPIYGQIQSFEVTNVLIIVVRYFGGTKLGVSGLINAYRTTALMALEASTVITNIITQNIKVVFEYANINKVMRIIKEKNLNIVNQKLELECEIIIAVRLKEVSHILKVFESHHGITTTVL